MDKRLVFNNIPEEYDKWRPVYVQELYADIFSYSNIDETSHALEVGIGTGKATLPFLEKNCRITAVELGDKLAEYTRRKFSEYTNLEVITEDFEKYVCPDNTYDLIYSACAFHWIPEEIGYPKVYSLLKRGGTFARFANCPQRDKYNEPLYDAIQQVYARYMPNTAPPQDYTHENCKKKANIALKYGFTDISYKMYHQKRIFDADSYVAHQHTHSNHADMDAERWAAFSGEIKAAINAYGGIINVYDVMELQLARKLV